MNEATKIIDNQKATLTTDFYTINFTYTNLFGKNIISLYYSYDNSQSKFKGRSRKIHTDKNGQYFIHGRNKVRMETNKG